MEAETAEVLPLGVLDRLRARYGRAGEAARNLVLGIGSRLPPALAYRVGGAIGLTMYWRRRRMPMRPELERFAGSRAQLRRWKRGQCRQMAYAGLELKAGMREGRERSARLLRFQGLEHLDAALAEGGGALLYTLHLCGIYTLFAALAARGYEMNLIRRAPPASLSPWQLARAQRRDTAVERAWGCRFLWMEPDNFGVAVQATNALRRNEVVVTLIDHLHSGPGVEVEMLGAPTVLAGGYGRLAEAAGAPLLDVFLHRGARSHPLVAEVGAPLRPAKTLPATVQECASRLGSHLERHPEVWIASPDGL